MIKKLFILLLIVFSHPSYAQKLYPAKWTFKTGETKNGETELIFKVKMDKGWHIYSQFTPDGGPLPMMFTFDPGTCYSLIGKVSEPKPIQEYDSTFMINVLMHSGEVTFKQKVKLNDPSCKITGKIEYQACLEMCIALDTAFTFIAGKQKSEISPVSKDVFSQSNFPSGNTTAIKK